MSTTPNEPTLENAYEDVILPGNRGTETHGVPQYGFPDNEDRWPDGDKPVVQDEPILHDAIPVYIVQQNDDQRYRKFRTMRAYMVATGPVNIVGRNDQRTQVRIYNLSTNASDRIWIAQAEHLANPQTGYPLDPGAANALTLTTETGIVGMLDPAGTSGLAGNAVQVAIMVEYEVGGR